MKFGRIVPYSLLVVLPLLALPACAQANELALADPDIYSKSLAALTMLFVIAVLLENAFSTIFNWRVFLTYFSLRGVKTIIMVAVALAVVYGFDIDIVASLVAAYKQPGSEATIDASSGLASRFITALILAGGSAGVYNIMYALGYRNDRREQEVAARPPNDKAWVAVRVTPRNATHDIFVHIADKGSAAGNANAPAPIAGAVGRRRRPIGELLLRNANRFPQNGGYTVLSNVIYEISVTGKDAQETALPPVTGTYVFAPGAIIDFEVTL